MMAEEIYRKDNQPRTFCTRRRRVAMATFCVIVARWSAVLPSEASTLTSIPFSTKYRALIMSPLRQASWIGRRPPSLHFSNWADAVAVRFGDGGADDLLFRFHDVNFSLMTIIFLQVWQRTWSFIYLWLFNHDHDRDKTINWSRAPMGPAAHLICVAINRNL